MQNKLELFSGKQNLHSYAAMGNRSFSVRQECELIEKMEYKLHNIAVGINEVGIPLRINLKSAEQHILIIGSTGAGKSFLTRRIWNSFYNAGGSVAIPVDIKPEYGFSKKPLQTKFHKFLLPMNSGRACQNCGNEHEETMGFPVKSYRPFFLTKSTNIETDKDEVITQIPLSDINTQTLDMLMDVTELTDAKRVAISNAFQKVKQETIPSIDRMCEIVDQEEEIGHTLTKKSIINILKDIQSKGIIGDRFDSMDFINDMNNGLIPILNLSGAFRSGSTDHTAATYVAYVVRQILEAKKEGRFPVDKPIMIVLDEINFYAGASDDTVARATILEALDTARSSNIRMCFSTQDIRRIHPTILDQCKYIFTGYDISPDSFKEIVLKKEPHKFNDHYTFRQEISWILGNMKKHRNGSRDWNFINASKRDDNYNIFNPLAPLSHHRTEGE